MKIVKILTGERFGRLVVLSDHKSVRLKNNRETWWYCRCDCGTEKWIRRQSLTTGETQSCGCLARERTSQRARRMPYGGHYSILVKAAEKSDRECSISYEQFLEFTTIDKCHYCLQKVTWHKHTPKANSGRSYQLDRKDNAVGYIPGNCVVCCKRCNYGKANNYTYKEWWQMTAIYRRTEQMNIGDVVVHKSLGGQPLVVVSIYSNFITVRYGTQGQSGVVFIEQEFALNELETPVESIEREGEIFRALNTKKKEIETNEPTGKLIPIN